MIWPSAWVLVVVAGWTAVGSFVANQMMMPVFRRYALARPNPRSSHSVPTPQGGGIGILLACIAAVFVAAPADWPGGNTPWPLASMVLGAVVLAIVGLIDDLRPLPVLPRLGAQILAACLGLMATGATSGATLLSLPPWLLLPLAGLGLIWFVNLTNFMDGIDGITIAEFVPILTVLALLTAAGRFDPGAGILAAGLLGGLVGFEPHNRHVAKLFLGDVGSLAIGFVAGCLLLKLALDGHLVAAVILPLYYLADATITLARRLIGGERITQAHRTHFYQRATDLGWRVPEITGLIAKVNIGLGMLAIAAAWDVSAIVQLATMAAAVVLTAWLLRRLSREPQR